MEAVVCYGHSRNSARVHRMARLWRFLLEDGWRLEPEGKKETLTTVVSNGRHERETVQAVTLVCRERVQQLTAEQIGNVPRDDVEYIATATGTTVARSVGDRENRPHEFEKHGTTTESRVAVSSGGVGPSWPRAKSTPSAGVTAAARLAGEAGPPGIAKQSVTTESDNAGSSDEARPPGIGKQSATTESDNAVFFGEVGPSWSNANGMNSAAATADAMPADEARLLELLRQLCDFQEVGRRRVASF